MILVLIFYLLNFALFVFFKLLFCVLHISIYHSKQYRPDPTLHKTRPQSNRRFTFVICEGLVLTKTASFQSLLWKYSGSVLKSIEVYSRLVIYLTIILLISPAPSKIHIRNLLQWSTSDQGFLSVSNSRSIVGLLWFY